MQLGPSHGQGMELLQEGQSSYVYISSQFCAILLESVMAIC